MHVVSLHGTSSHGGPQMPMDRADSLIAELSSRHQNQSPKFLAAVRPLVVNILDEKTPEEARIPLLELLAETFERDVATRKNCAAARVAWQQWAEALRRLLGGENRG